MNLTTEISRLVDRGIGVLFIYLTKLLSPLLPKAPEKPNKILVVKLWAMGESILTLPLIQSIKEKYPKSKIDVLCRDAVRPVFTENKSINNVISAEFGKLFSLMHKFQSYDLVFDTEPYLNLSALYAWYLAKRRIGFSHGARSLLYTDKVKYNDKQHVVLTYMDMAKKLGIKVTPKNLVPLGFTVKDYKKVQSLFRDWKIAKKDKILCIAPGVGKAGTNRMWPAKKFAAVADKLAKRFKLKVLLIGSKDEYPLCQQVAEAMKAKSINIAGKTNIEELAIVLKLSRLMIGNDSGPMHLSASMGTATVGLFGPNTPVRFGPYGPKNMFVYKPVMKQPCINVHKGKIPLCRNHKHMSKITVDDVAQAAARAIKK